VGEAWADRAVAEVDALPAAIAMPRPLWTARRARGGRHGTGLSSEHALELRKSVGAFVGTARRVGRAGAGRRGGAREAGGGSGGNRERNQAIRDWAKSKGVEVSDRGRISQELVDQYDAEVGT
jgi:hypothetical protein